MANTIWQVLKTTIFMNLTCILIFYHLELKEMQLKNLRQKKQKVWKFQELAKKKVWDVEFKITLSLWNGRHARVFILWNIAYQWHLIYTPHLCSRLFHDVCCGGNYSRLLTYNLYHQKLCKNRTSYLVIFQAKHMNK